MARGFCLAPWPHDCAMFGQRRTELALGVGRQRKHGVEVMLGRLGKVTRRSPSAFACGPALVLVSCFALAHDIRCNHHLVCPADAHFRCATILHHLQSCHLDSVLRISQTLRDYFGTLPAELRSFGDVSFHHHQQQHSNASRLTATLVFSSPPLQHPISTPSGSVHCTKLC